MHFGKYKMSMIHYFNEFIMKAYIIHENDEWTLPLKEQLQKLSVPFEDWHMAKVNLNTASTPPVGVDYLFKINLLIYLLWFTNFYI